MPAKRPPTSASVNQNSGLPEGTASGRMDYWKIPSPGASSLKEQDIEDACIERLIGLKYDYRPDITNRATLERNFRGKFEALNRCKLTDAEFARLLDEIVSADVFTAARTLREINSFTRDGTPLNYSLVNLKEDGLQFLPSSFLLQISPTASTLLKLNEHIHKCLFVVDRKDLTLHS